LVIIGEQLRGRFWSHDRCRVTIKRDHHSLAIQPFRFGLYMRNYRTVTLVHAVVCANRDNRSPRWRNCGIGITKNKHEYLRYRFSQNH
jgi:hypothetical protein